MGRESCDAFSVLSLFPSASSLTRFSQSTHPRTHPPSVNSVLERVTQIPEMCRTCVSAFEHFLQFLSFRFLPSWDVLRNARARAVGTFSPNEISLSFLFLITPHLTRHALPIGQFSSIPRLLVAQRATRAADFTISVSANGNRILIRSHAGIVESIVGSERSSSADALSRLLIMSSSRRPHEITTLA